MTLVVVVLLASCNNKEILRQTEPIYNPRYAEGFSIERDKASGEVLLCVKNPWQGAENICYYYPIDTLSPAQRIVTMSSSHAAMLDAVGCSDRIVGLSGSLGWIYFIYFFSIGYGFAISTLSLASVIIFRDVITLPIAILAAVLFIYGIRLGLFLLLREKKSASYKHILYQPENTTRKPAFVMWMIWISCALLYVGQISPATFYLYNLENGAPVNEAWA